MDQREVDTQSNNRSEISPLLENIVQIWGKRRFIFWNTFGFAILSIVISLLLPKWYMSSASIVSSGGNSSNFLSMLSGLPLGDFGLAGLSKDISNYIAILESRDLREGVVTQFDLIKRYESKNIEYALQTLDENVEIKVTEEGTLKVTVIDKDPVVARDMANKFIDELDVINRRLSSEKGKFNREFLENRLIQNKSDIKNAEDKLKKFQHRYGLIDVPSQVSAAIENYTKLYASKVEIDIEYEIAKATYSVNDPKVIQLQQMSVIINQLLEDMILKGDEKNVLLAFNDLPDLGLEYVRLYREVELQSKILEFLLPQYEQARMEETKNIPSLQIIDTPRISINKVKPQRALIVIGTTFMAMLLSLLYVIVEYKTRFMREHLKQQ